MINENGTLVEFFREAVQNNFKSAAEGRPIYEDRDFVRITTPGDTKTVVVNIATDQYKARFPKAWALFEKGVEQAQEGTPLEQWTGISRSQVKELKHVNIATVEVLAGVSDANIQKLGPGYRQLRDAAKAYLESAKSNAHVTQWAAEKETLENKIKVLEDQIKSITAAAKASKKDDEKKGDEGDNHKEKKH